MHTGKQKQRNASYQASLVNRHIRRFTGFINEETEGALPDTVTYFSDQHLTWLSQLKPNAKLG